MGLNSKVGQPNKNIEKVKKYRKEQRGTSPKQISFNISKIDKTQKWDTMKKFLGDLIDDFANQKILNEINNEKLLKKLYNLMCKLETQEEAHIKGLKR